MTLCMENSGRGHLIKNHPCFSENAHGVYGRIHLPVSPACNIGCRFCSRSFNKTEQRPGVSRVLLSPAEAVEKVRLAIELCPEISVAGIAGPGESLATDDALDTLEAVHKEFPHLIKCLSTNGLLLSEKAERIARSGVQTVSVTVNSIDPDVQKNIVSQVIYKGKVLQGREGAEKLISSQIEGIKKIIELGITVKLNTVLIPGINENSIEEVAELASALDVFMMNVIPLIPQHEMSGMRPPDCGEINSAREKVERHIQVFRQCRQCRADACGIPGKSEFSSQLYDEPLNTFSHG